MLQKFVTIFGGDPNKREIEKLSGLVDEINALEPQFEALSDEILRAKTDEFRARLSAALPPLEETEGGPDEKELRQAEQDVLNEILSEAFAAVREASKRTIGLRHFDVQLIGGVVLHRGQIAEMKTGEGKTLVATLPLYLNALTSRGCHLVTVNDYLARRDARWMGPIYDALGLSVGILQMAAATENGKKAFLYDPSKESSREDQDQLRLVDRRLAYAADITYGTNSEFGFDYLRDNMTMRLDERVQRGHHYAIVDEVDNVLIDEARTPLIISGPASGDVEWYGKMAQLVRQLRAEDYEISEKDRTVSMTEIGTAHVEQLLGQPLRDPDRPEDVTPEQARLLGYLEQALRAQHLFKRNKDYLVQGGKVIIVDEFTGRLMPGRRWSDGLHQAVEAKEGVRVEPENVTYATITLQNYFRMYEKLAGMTGTALTEAEEFSKIYKLEVLPVPTNLEYQAFGLEAPLVEVKAKDEDGFEYSYFARRTPPVPPPSSEKMGGSEGGAIFFRRKDYPDSIYRTAEAKLRALVREIVCEHVRGRPMLVGTTSVESSERLSNRLRAEPVRRLMQVLLIRNAWLQANDRFEDGRLIPELAPLNRPLEQLRPEELRPMARDLGLSLNPEDQANLTRLREILRLDESDENRLKSVLQGGAPHQVLNARKHTEESQVIAGAGAFGAVTIATNMAGRGVDIKLGGELAEEIIAAVARVLRKTGYKDPYDMTLQERREALQKVDPSLYGIYETEVKFFLKYFEDMERVKELGGLHVIGSERHEARRIDNQLRGRSARQGDPGSSRFYLSLEDDLMRLFGGEQVNGLMQRLSIDDDYPLQARLVSGIIEQSQHRVEGANFDVRKHLLEYDDVLNSQRMRIYSQRNRVFEKEDLSEDVDELLRLEVERRVSEAIESGEVWRLLAWLEQIQPVFGVAEGAFPSFTYKILLRELTDSKTDPSAPLRSVQGVGSGQGLRTSLMDIARRTLQAEHAYFLHAIQEQIDRAGEGLDSQIKDRTDALDTFLDAIKDNEEGGPRRPQETLEELQGLVHIPLRLSPEQMRSLAEDPREVEDTIRDQIEAFIASLTLTRLIATIEFRLGESLGLEAAELQDLDWDEVAERVEDKTREVLDSRQARLVGEDGQITRDLDSALERLGDVPLDDQFRLRLLSLMAQGARTYFDSKTHRQMRQVFTRLHYVYLGNELLADISSDTLTDDVLEHLEQAQIALRRAWGESEFRRLSQNADRLADLGPAAAVLGEDRLEQPLSTLSESDRAALTEALGRRVQTEIYRQILLGAITELWVDYLTRVEALRVSIGLEAYAQRDPLVQYKSQASEMFQNLLGEIRAAVISRIFLYQPRTFAAAQLEMAPEPAPAGAPVAQAQTASRKKKRHRH
jgi:preprotein translocase subunit SecA